jgi:hypothetical protein
MTRRRSSSSRSTPSRDLAPDPSGGDRWERSRKRFETTISDETRDRIDEAAKRLGERLGVDGTRLRGRVVDGAMAALSVEQVVEAAARGMSDGALASLPALTERQLFVAKAHFDLLRAITAGAGHTRDTTPGVTPLADAGLVTLDEFGLARVSPVGGLALSAVRRECEGTALDHRGARRTLPSKR